MASNPLDRMPARIGLLNVLDNAPRNDATELTLFDALIRMAQESEGTDDEKAQELEGLIRIIEQERLRKQSQSQPIQQVTPGSPLHKELQRQRQGRVPPTGIINT